MVITGRFSGAPWHDKIQELQVSVVGCGGIGSWVSLLLSRVQPGLMMLHDDDVFDDSNMAGQHAYSLDRGHPKVQVCAKRLRDFSNYRDVIAVKERVQKEYRGLPNCLCGVDSMAARRNVFRHWLDRYKGADSIFVDGRLAAERWEVYAIRADDAWAGEKYLAECLPDDSRVPDGPCSYKQTSHFAAMIASVMVGRLCSHASCLAGEERLIPFKESYDGVNGIREIIQN
jgi:hypothetical protein